MKIGPKYKICRRLGERVFAKCQTTKFSISGSAQRPGQGRKSAVPKTAARPGGPRPAGRRNLSEYGSQLLEKQKARYTYGLGERQFARQVKRHREEIALYQSLETRIDNAVFRLGWAPSRAAARQAVTHGHILVNGRRVSTPSSSVRPGDKISLRPSSRERPLFRDLGERLKNYQPPAWLAAPSIGEGEVLASPVVGESELNLNFGAIIGFYSRV
ncbi:MAG: 30S ribosomal protein S4 [Candidatus Vogelbacteria bacterium]|nr:30S ribosomal protein S4 [Candidatus Vogelbacteria bacterium]